MDWTGSTSVAPAWKERAEAVHAYIAKLRKMEAKERTKRRSATKLVSAIKKVIARTLR